MNGLCKDCRSWDTNEDTAPKGWGVCAKTWMRDFSLADFDTIDHPPKDTLAQATDWEGYKAVLETAPDFGCNQFEART